ncbi:MAG: poly(A) polymerase, partial [Sphaerochaetaceae bacterium]|nr:poly(A) polymerase [Sphaerochaetaceae bacterium]
MITRYKNGADGLDAVANIYSKNENGIDASLIDKEAVSVIRRLTDMGYESYLVGGAVRDLILGRVPKDFDVATSASPRQVHKLFYNSRIIGRRFKIVHIVYGK